MNDKDLEAFESWQKEIIQELKFNSVIGDNKHRGSLEFAWQAACEYKEDELMEYKEAARSEADEVNILQAENKKLREALEFYADKNNWRKEFGNKLEYNAHRIKEDFTLDENFTPYGGKRAREALKEIE
jgi:hypothetical protein